MVNESEIKEQKNRKYFQPESKTDKKRDTTMDFAKGLAILLMILDHILAKGAFITSFHMPLFFFISGYFLKEEPLATTFHKKVKGILVPYLKFGLLLCVARSLYIVFFMDYTWRASGYVFLVSLGNLFLARNVFLLWFLCALFLALMLYAIIVKLTGDHLWIRWTAVLAGLALGGYLSQYTDQNLWYIDVALVSISFVAAGATYRKYKGHLSPLIKLTVLTISALFWGISIYHGGLVLALRKYPNFPVCILGAIAGTIIVITCSSYLRRIPILGYTITWCGQRTLEILAIANLIQAIPGLKLLFHFLPTFLQFALQVAIIVIIIILWEQVSHRRHTSNEIGR